MTDEYNNHKSHQAYTGRKIIGMAAMTSTLLISTEMAAQESQQFGVAPAARTQRALSDSPTVSSRGQEGLYAALGVAYTHHSNVRRETVDDAATNGPGDSAIVVTPQVGYKRFIGRHSAEVSVATQFTRFRDLTDENTDNYSIDALTNLDITRILDLDLFGSFTEASEPRGGSGTRENQNIEPDQVEVTSYGGLFTLGRRVARIQIQAGADRSELRYQNNQQEFRDRNDDRVHGRVFYNISPRTSVFAGASLTEVTYLDRLDNLDSEELTYEAGVRWDVTAKTTGSVSVGQTEKDFDDPSREDAGATTLAGRVSWSPRTRTTFNVYGSKQFEETTSVEDDFFVSELIGTSVRQALGNRWHADMYINRTTDDYESDREDEILDYGIGLDYEFREWLSIGARYSRVERDSNVPGNDYEDEILSLYLNGTFDFGR